MNIKCCNAFYLVILVILSASVSCQLIKRYGVRILVGPKKCFAEQKVLIGASFVSRRAHKSTGPGRKFPHVKIPAANGACVLSRILLKSGIWCVLVYNLVRFCFKIFLKINIL